MKRLFKDTLFVTVVIVSIAVLVAGICQLVSFLRHDEPEVILSFVISAKAFHEKIEGTNLLENIEVLLVAIPGESNENMSEIENMIREGMFNARQYRESYSWLPPTDDTLWLYNLLIKESTMIANCYSDLNFAWSAKQAGDYVSFEECCDATMTCPQ
jgi:hypothetical protein